MLRVEQDGSGTKGSLPGGPLGPVTHQAWAPHIPSGPTGWDDRQAWDGQGADGSGSGGRSGSSRQWRRLRRREAQKGRHSPTNPTVYLVNTILAPYKVVAEVTGSLLVPYKRALTINSYFTLKTGPLGLGSRGGRGKKERRKEGRAKTPSWSSSGQLHKLTDQEIKSEGESLLRSDLSKVSRDSGEHTANVTAWNMTDTFRTTSGPRGGATGRSGNPPSV